MAKDSSFTWSYRDPLSLNLSSFNVAVIGGTGGIGRAVANILATCGASVIVVGQTFRDGNKKNIEFIKADLSSIEESKKVARQLPVEKLDITLFTAGIFAAPKRQETKEGLERDMAVSYLSRLAMLNEIAPHLKDTKNSFGFLPRVFIMAFPGDGQLGNINDLNQEKSYGTLKAHMNTVAGNEALVTNMKDLYKNFNIYGLNPGIIKTNIRGNLFGEGSWKQKVTEYLIGWFTQTPDDYAKKIVPLLFAPEIEKYNGGFFDNKGNPILASKGLTKEYASKYIEKSEELLKSKGF